MNRLAIALALASPLAVHATGVLENPTPSSIVSGISVISGWSCEGSKIEIEIDAGPRTQVPSGVDRADTAAVCAGKRNTGFGQLTNWSVLSPGAHTLRVFADGAEFARASFTIQSLGAEFLRGKTAGATVYDFPAAGKSTTLKWQESMQSFVATDVADDAPTLFGRWNGANIERRSNCTSPPNNGQHGTYGQFDIANDGGVFTISEAAVTGLVCTYNGTYKQDGNQRSANGVYFCSDGKQGSFTSTGFLVTPTEMQVRMDIKLTGSESCTIDAILGGSRF